MNRYQRREKGAFPALHVSLSVKLFWTARPVVFSFNRRAGVHHVHHFHKKAKSFLPGMMRSWSAESLESEEERKYVF
jgi:hypothetical protein